MTKQTFTLTALKKHLAQKSKEQLIADIAELYKTFSPVKEFYQAQHADISEVAKKYKDIIIKEFGGTGRGFPKARFSVARNAFNDFKKLTNDPALVADMMLTYVESTSGYCSEYGPDGKEYYTRPATLFAQALQLIQEHNLQEDFRDRAHSIVRHATEGWGHQDSLRDCYDDFYH